LYWILLDRDAKAVKLDLNGGTPAPPLYLLSTTPSGSSRFSNLPATIFVVGELTFCGAETGQMTASPDFSHL
jgi:hypothetical protein